MTKKATKLSIIISSVVLVAAIIAGALITSKNKTTTVAFYDIPESYIQAYKDIISKDNTNQIKFIIFSEEQIKKTSATKKADLIITYNGAVAEKLAPKAITISDNLASRYPRTILSSPLYNLNNELKIFPINFDIFENMVLKTAVDHYDLPLPSTISQIEDFAKAAMDIYPIPIIFSGADDQVLNSFFTQLVESFGGAEGYTALLNQLKGQNDFEDFYNYKITGSPEGPVTVSTILDLIKYWEDKDYISQKWRTTTKANTAQLIEDNRVTMTMMNLSEHRDVESDNLNYYEKIIFPTVSGDFDNLHSIQPAVVAMIFKNTEATRIIANRLTLPDNQETLSLVTKLGPATLQGTSCDRQADDARFFAASFPAGPAPDLATMAFCDKARQHEMAEMIRGY